MNKRWAEKLDDAELKLKLEKYDRPANCHRLLVPKVNPEIWTNMPHGTKSADLRIANFHKTLTKANSALSKMTDSLLELRAKESSSDTERSKNFGQLVSLGNADASALLGNLHIDLSLHRRELIKPHLKRERGALCSTRTYDKFSFWWWPTRATFEHNSPRPRSPLQRFLYAVCIYSLALLLIYSDLTQLSELTQHKYTKSLRSRISCECVISIFVTRRQTMLRKWR